MTGVPSRVVLGAVLAAALSSPTGAQSWPPVDFGAFEAACRTQEGMLSYVEAAPLTEPPAINRLCGCMVESLGDLAQPDIDILTRDLLGTSSQDERTAHASYPALSERAGRAVLSCADKALAAASPEPTPAPAPPPATTLAQPAPQPPAAPAPPAESPQAGRMSPEAAGFLNSCGASAPFRDYLDERQAGASGAQGGICTCLTGALMGAVAPSDLVLLERDFGESPGDAVEESTTYDAAAEVAARSLKACMTEAGVPAGP